MSSRIRHLNGQVKMCCEIPLRLRIQSFVERFSLKSIIRFQELYYSINTLISTLIPAQKILPLSDDLSVSDLKNFVDSVSQENIKEIVSIDNRYSTVEYFGEFAKTFPHLNISLSRFNENF